MKKFSTYRQPDSKDCGPTCLKIIARHYGQSVSIQSLRIISETTRSGSNLLSFSEAAEQIGFRSIGVRINLEKLKEAPLHCILHWNKNHYVVLYKIKNDTFYISDPAHGLLKYSKSDFIKSWIGNNADDYIEEGIVLLLEPTPKLYNSDFEEDSKFGFGFISKYLFQYKRFLVQLIIGLIAGSLLQLIFPFLTQSIVDVGIRNQDIQFIYLILIAQIFLFLGRTTIEVLRGWILFDLLP